MRWLRWFFQPNPRRFLAVWYTVWLGFSLKGFVVNWLIRQQSIRIAWVPVTGLAETVYLLAELVVVGAIVWQAWQLERANWQFAFIYEWYSLIELGLSGLNPRLWTSAMNQMWCRPWSLFGELIQPCREPIVWGDGASNLMAHLGFILFYGLFHHGLPLWVLMKVARQARPRVAVS